MGFLCKIMAVLDQVGLELIFAWLCFLSAGFVSPLPGDSGLLDFYTGLVRTKCFIYKFSSVLYYN